MPILLLIDHREAQPWLEELKLELPEEIIEIYTTTIEPEKIDFVVTMRPKKEDFQKFPNIKVVQCIGAGVNYILAENVVQPNMVLARIVDPYLSKDMFEFVLGVVVSETKQLPRYVQLQQQKVWASQPYKRFEDTHIAILGLGKIGAYVAEQFAALGFKVSGWSNSPKDLVGVTSYVGEKGLSACLSQADFLVNILPLTAATTHILNKKTLGYLPKGAFLVNVGRGLHNQESDIIELLDNEQLSGALIDVFSQEPLPTTHPFWTHPKVFITPHVASVTNAKSAVKQIAANYRRFKKGEALANVVSLKKGY